MGAVESPGAPQWGDFRAGQLREWFATTPFYAGKLLASVRFDPVESLYYLRDTEGRVCCAMRAEEMRKVVAP